MCRRGRYRARALAPKPLARPRFFLLSRLILCGSERGGARPCFFLLARLILCGSERGGARPRFLLAHLILRGSERDGGRGGGRASRLVVCFEDGRGGGRSDWLGGGRPRRLIGWVSDQLDRRRTDGTARRALGRSQPWFDALLVEEMRARPQLRIEVRA